VVETILLKGWHRPTKADPDGRITFELFQSELQASSEAQLLQNAEYLTDVYSYIMDELYPCDNDAIKQTVRAISETDRQTEETVGNYSRPEGLRVFGHALLRSYAIIDWMHLRDDDARFDITQLIPGFLRMWEKSIDSLKILVLQKEEDEAFFLFLCVMIILHDLLMRSTTLTDSTTIKSSPLRSPDWMRFWRNQLPCSKCATRSKSKTIIEPKKASSEHTSSQIRRLGQLMTIFKRTKHFGGFWTVLPV